MREHKAKLVVALLATCGCSSIPAAMYRWVDESGLTVYSQTPPPSGEAVRLAAPPSASAEAGKEARDRLRLQREQRFDDEEARKDAATEQVKKVEDQQRRAANCTAARKNLETLRNLGPRMIRTPDGRYLRLSEEELETRIEKAQDQAEEYCE